jgi:hypothetical protein
MCWTQVEELEHQNMLQVDEASEAEGCVRGAQRWKEQTEQTELMEPEVNTKCWRQANQSELITDGWNLSLVTSATCRI